MRTPSSRPPSTRALAWRRRGERIAVNDDLAVYARRHPAACRRRRRGDRRRGHRHHPEAASRGAQIICLQELFNAPYFCKVTDAERFDLAEPIPGPTVERDAGARAGARRRDRRPDLREARRPASTATRPRSSTPTARCSACIARCTSPTIRSITRSTTSRPARSTSTARRRASRRLPRVAHALRDDRRADLLGPVVSGGGAHHGAHGRGDAVLSDGDRLAPGGEGGVGRGAGGRVAHDPARARDRERRVRRAAEPRRPRSRAGHRRHRVLRPLLHQRSVRPAHRRGGDGAGDAGRAVRSRAASRRRAATGRSCATAASTPTGRS